MQSVGIAIFFLLILTGMFSWVYALVERSRFSRRSLKRFSTGAVMMRGSVSGKLSLGKSRFDSVAEGLDMVPLGDNTLGIAPHLVSSSKFRPSLRSLMPYSITLREMGSHVQLAIRVPVGFAMFSTSAFLGILTHMVVFSREYESSGSGVTFLVPIPFGVLLGVSVLIMFATRRRAQRDMAGILNAVVVRNAA